MMAVFNQCERCGVEDDPSVGSHSVRCSTHVVCDYWHRTYWLCDTCGVVMTKAVEAAMVPKLVGILTPRGGPEVPGCEGSPDT